MSHFAPVMLGSIVAIAVGSTEAAPYLDKRAVKEDDLENDGKNNSSSKKSSNEKTVNKAEVVETQFANKPTEAAKETKGAKSAAETTSKHTSKEATKTPTNSVASKPSSSAASAKTSAKGKDDVSSAVPSQSKPASSAPIATSASTATSVSTATSAPTATSASSTSIPTTASISSSLIPSSSSSAINSPSISNSAALADKASDETSGMSGGAIGGIIAAILIIVIGACSFIALRRRQERKKRHMNMSSKPDPFTMGFGSDSAFNGGYQPPMQQVDQYQHQYGTQPAVAENISTEPPAQQYQQNIPSGNNTSVSTDTAITGAISAAGAAGAAAAVGSAVAFNESTPTSQTPLAPTQPDSLGVFYVAATYTPTLSDEIDIQTGDQVEILVEYDDGWCQGINLSRGNVKGVFPKHCIDYTPPDQFIQSTTPNTLNPSPEIDRTKRVSSMFIG